MKAASGPGADGDVLTAALDYGRRGWFVFPVNGKAPDLTWVAHWSQESSTDPAQITAWFAGSTRLGIGLDLAKSELVVVDGDCLDRLVQTLPADLLTGWTWHGNPDRRSWLFGLNGTPVPQAGHDWGEVKSAGGYVVLPPSPHQDEKCLACPEGDHCYVWEDVDGDSPPAISDDLIRLIAPKRTKSATANPAPWTGNAVTDADKDAVAKLLDEWQRKVAECQPGEGEYGGRNKTLNNAAFALGHYAPHYIDPAYVTEALFKASEHCGLVEDDGERSVRSTISSGLEAGMRDPQTVRTPAPSQGQQGQGSMAHRMVAQVMDTHRLFVGDDGRYYMVRGDAGRLAEPITSSAVIRECLSVAGTSSLASPAKDAAVVLRALAADSEPVNLSLRVARHEGGLVLDLGQRGNTKCVHITAEGWTVLESPPAGVLFRRSKVTQPLPEPVHGGSLDRLRGILDLDDAQWKVVKGWLPASLMPHVPRPMLAFLGVQGSAKTTRAAMVCAVYDPKPEHALGSSFAKSLSDDRIKALSHYVVTYDNLTNISRDASDHLARMVTGDSADARQLYTDGDLFTVTYKRTGLFTAITLPPLQPDARERVVPINLERIPEHKRRAEEELWEEFNAAWPETLGAVLDLAVTMLANLPTVRADTTVKPRMADYYLAVKAVGPDLADAYWAAVDDSMREAAEDDPFVAVVVKWLDEQWSDPLNKDNDLTFTPTAAWREAGYHRDVEDIDVRGKAAPWWPNSARLFSAAIIRASEPLRSLGIHADSGKSNGERFLRFRRVAQTGTQAGSMDPEQGR